MKIQVTRQDIRLGTPHSECSCPIALAVGRTRPDTNPSVFVDSDFIQIGYSYFRTPRVAFKFMQAFDAGQPVEPFEFEI